MSTWTDDSGRFWCVPTAHSRLKFSNPGAAALRAYVHRRDGYSCVRCGMEALDVQHPYTGRHQLVGPGFDGYLFFVLDHKLALAAGGTHLPSNLQTLCAACNQEKVWIVDMPLILAHRQQTRQQEWRVGR